MTREQEKELWDLLHTLDKAQLVKLIIFAFKLQLKGQNDDKNS